VTVYFRQRQKGTSVPFTTNRFDLEFLGANWESQRHTIDFQGTAAAMTYTLPFQPVSVMVDPDEKTGDATTDYGAVIKSAGLRSFPDTYFTLNTQQVSDSAFVRVTHHWIAPDSLLPAVPGLKISPARYWKIEGLLPQGFSAQGKFYYSQFGNLDNTLITHMQDSLVLLYRPSKAETWQGISFIMDGSPSQGELITNQVLTGEYSLAAWDHNYLGMTEFSSKETSMKVFPNPSKGLVNIRLSPQKGGTMNIRKAEGKLVDSLQVSPDQAKLEWKPSKPVASTYYFEFIVPGKGILSRAKVVVIP